MGLIPEGWLEYTPIGAQIEGTRFIAFKVPLDKLDLSKTNEEAQGIGVKTNDMLNTQIMFERIPNLGLVIDLTNTKKYYDSKHVTDLGIEYKKIFVPGRVLPTKAIYSEFTSTVTDFLRRNAENDKLIGVHCTHGLNRTGLMICSYMIQNCNIQSTDAIYRFETARGHKMERENYLESLRKMVAKQTLVEKERSQSPQIVIHDNRRTLTTQTNPGIWVESKHTPKTKRIKKQNHTTNIEDVKQIKGTILVDGKNLISDGCGGYLMRVELSDIRIFSSKSDVQNNRNHLPNSSDHRRKPNGSNCSDHCSPRKRSDNRPSPSGTFYADNFRYSNEHRSNHIHTIHPYEYRDQIRYPPSEYRFDRRSIDNRSVNQEQNTKYFNDYV